MLADEQLTLQAFEQLTTSQLALLANELAVGLGEQWCPYDSWQHNGIALYNHSTQHVFVLVPGGTYTMGATATDIQAATCLIDGSNEPEFSSFLQGLLACALPPREVYIAPFLCCLTSCRDNSGDRLLVGRNAAQRYAADAGFRLPSEAEYEWLLRDGGQCSFTLEADMAARDEELWSRFGILDLERGCWMEDDWHPTYDGAPTDSSAWGDGDPAGVVREGTSLNLILVQEDILEQLACLRTRGSNLCGIRLCASL